MPGIEALLTGRTLADRYRIEAVIGRGGMGAVYRATDERLGRAVALKVITVATGVDGDARDRVRARFRQEAASAARLPHHPNVVPVYDYGTDPELGLDFIVMELLRGEDLATRLSRSGPPPLGLALRILREAARGVAVGHRAGLVHRDVKPGNVFLVQDDDPKQMQIRVLDFGIAKAVTEEDTHTALTQDGRAPLSPGYASPEQLRGDARLTPASDVFSLGALGYQMLTGQRAFTEQDRNRMSVGMDVPIPSLRSRNASIPEEVEALIQKALASNPLDRFPSAWEMAEALDEAVRSLNSEAAAAKVPAGPGAVAAAGFPPPEDDHTELAPPEDRTAMAPPSRPVPPPPAAVQEAPDARPVISSRRHQPRPAGGGGRVALAAVLLLVLVAAAVVGVTQFGSRGRPAESPLSDLPDSVRVDSAITPEAPDPTDGMALKLEGLRAIQAGDWRTAEQHLGLATMLLPTDVQALDAYAFAMLNQGRPADAERVLLQAQRVDPQYDLVYSHLADALLAQGDSARARTALERFVSLTLDRSAREQAVRRLETLRPAAPTPEPVEPEPPTPQPEAPRDTLRVPPEAPRDSIRLPTRR
jgi:eukaryotic-like serine/threonine-protein kinase